MKIIRLSTFLDFGGVETRLANISHINDEHEWVFVCMNRDGKAARIIKENGKKVINLLCKPSIYSIQTLFKVYRILRKEKPDVIHTSGAEANFHGILAAKLAGIPVIIGEEIGVPNHGTMARFIFSNVYRYAHYIVGNSDKVLEVVHEIDNVPLNKLKKIENPILFKKLPIRLQNNSLVQKFRILTISRLEPVKNIEGLINVIARLRNETSYKVQLTIAGLGSIENLLRTMVIDLKLEDDIKFIGFINDPYPYLLESDLYVLNSFTEGFSNSLVEAMYSNTPSLSTTVGAAYEIILDGTNGFLVEPDNEQALFEKLKSILSMNVDERENIGIAGHKTIFENFSLENHVGKLMQVYKG